MTVQFLGAVFLRVSNLEESMRFYSDVLGLELRDVEQWENGRGANYIIGESSPGLTLIETKDDLHILKQPAFNLFCNDVLSIYDRLKSQGYKVGQVNKWSSVLNDHIDFDVYDPDGNAINLIEWHRKNN
ncbi:VOC family protein [Bacillus sp. FJAT-49732]|uniref:VOC family protein n=1 Tax=Lederbergia citrisecunda TaxID=2833583 RepID=A0A942TS48_9BACI|nr:VOC family protein [Lederbergia citrisecunda]MBS4201871.1 VOC family protein [Lederbergia citrisecunda]